MMKYEALLNRPFDYGRTDCFSLVRDFYEANFGIEITNYARSSDWWSEGLNLMMDNYHREGFRVVDDHPSEWRVADLILMAIASPVANHLGVLVESGKMLHHMPGRLSRVEDYRGLYRNNTVAVLRHKNVVLPLDESPVDLMSLLPANLQKKLAR